MKQSLLWLNACLLIILAITFMMDFEPNKIVIDSHKADSAAVDILVHINPVSMHENLEYAGVIVATSSRTFASTPITHGNAHMSFIPAWKNTVYTGYVVGTYHTHGAKSKEPGDPGYDPEAKTYDDCHFSPVDTLGRKLTQYLATPCGTFLKFNPKDRMVHAYDRNTEKWYQYRPSIMR